jgi:hypothetical protein
MIELDLAIRALAAAAKESPFLIYCRSRNAGPVFTTPQRRPGQPDTRTAMLRPDPFKIECLIVYDGARRCHDTDHGRPISPLRRLRLPSGGERALAPSRSEAMVGRGRGSP